MKDDRVPMIEIKETWCTDIQQNIRILAQKPVYGDIIGTMNSIPDSRLKKEVT